MDIIIDSMCVVEWTYGYTAFAVVYINIEVMCVMVKGHIELLCMLVN